MIGSPEFQWRIAGFALLLQLVMLAVVSSICTARHALRTATAPDHHRVDRAFSAFDLTQRAHYAAFLKAQARALVPVESAIDAADPACYLPDWAARRRAHLLADDLARLGEAPGDPPPAPDFVTQAETLGAIYVLEGSRLGGEVLARTLPSDFPRRFLSAPDSRRWRGLIEVLDQRLQSQQDRAVAIAAARDVFARFEMAARVELGMMH